MAFDNSNRGALFANERKTKPNQPDFTGNVVLSQELILHATREIAAGREPKLSLSAWNKTSGAGKRFLSLSLDKPYDPAAQGQGQGSSVRGSVRTNTEPSWGSDDVPF